MKFDKKWKDEKEKSLYPGIEDKPVTQRQLFYNEYWKYIEKFVGFKHSKKRVLEVGCGRGTISEYIRFRSPFVIGHELTLLDSSKEALSIANENLGRAYKELFIRGEATELPLIDGSFDVVISMGVIEHIDNFTEFLREQSRVLESGGLLICMIVPHKFSSQVLNIFGSDKYKRTPITPRVYEETLKRVGDFEWTDVTWMNYLPLFTPIPMWLDKIITKVFRLIIRLFGFKGPKILCQTAILVAQKS